MASELETLQDAVCDWARWYTFANRTAIDAALRPFDLGTTQWNVLRQLATQGAMMQSDLGQLLRLNRPTLSGILATLVRKKLIEQVADPVDQRQRRIQLTGAGSDLWQQLPDPTSDIRARSFEGFSDAELETTLRVLQAAAQRVNDSTAEADAP